MSFTEFCCRSGGSNLNAGTRTGNSTEPGTAADLTYASGTWVNATAVFTVASGNPQSDGVAVGDFAALDTGGATAAYIARVTARSTTTITLSTTAKSGTNPADGTYTLRIGGAWKGPNSAEAFPWGFITNALTNSSGDIPRVNFKNAASFSITGALTHDKAGPLYFEGYASAYGDLGTPAIIDGGTGGTSYTVLTVSGGAGNYFRNFKFQNNGATGSASMVVCGTANQTFEKCKFTACRGNGLHVTTGFPGYTASECEAYGCNASNATGQAGFSGTSGAVCTFLRCIAHDNTGNVTEGFSVNGIFTDCIADSNGRRGFASVTGAMKMSGCVAYNNGGDGFWFNGTGGNSYHIENCIAANNGGFGGNNSGGLAANVRLINCAFRSNTSGQTTGAVDATGSITCSADPMTDAANGNFVSNTSEVKGQGRGIYLQDAGSYSATTTGFPDVGIQHQDAGGRLLLNPGFSGGMRG